MRIDFQTTVYLVIDSKCADFALKICCSEYSVNDLVPDLINTTNYWVGYSLANE